MRVFWILLIVLNVYNQNVFGWVENPEYWLYTRANLNVVKFRTPYKSNLLQTSFSFSKDTYFIIHGWMNSGNMLEIQAIKNALLKKMDVNVIIVDWEATAFNFYYFVRYSIEEMAGRLYELVKFTIDNGYSTNKVNMIGFSMGAHIAGLVGKKIGNRQISSITGIDPAYMMFNVNDQNGRLCPTDAKYVEVIHTNAGLIGFLDPIGDVDVYINGGTYQPECGFLIGFCNHYRGIVRYLETVSNDKDYFAYKCTGYDTATRGACTKDVAIKVGGILPKPWIPGIYWVSTITDW